MALRCRFGRHRGQAEGGTMMYTCPDCGGSFWQKHDFSQVTAIADRMIDRGRHDEALAFAQSAVRRRLSDERE